MKEEGKMIIMNQDIAEDYISLMLKRKIAGNVKIVTTIKLKAKRPIKFKIWSISGDQERL